MNKIRFCLISMFLFSIITCVSFTPENLYQYYIDFYSKSPSRSEYSDKIIDPNNFIKNYTILNSMIRHIEQERNLTIVFVVIERMGNDFYPNKKNRIGYFGDNFAEIFFKTTKAIDNSLTIIFSISDRKNRISTGREVRKVYKDQLCLYLLSSLKQKLRRAEYDEAFQSLFTEIRYIEDSKRITDKDGLMVFMILGYLILLLFIVLPSDEESEREAENDYSKIGSEEKNKIEKVSKMLEEMDKNKNNVKEIFTETCIICLDKIPDEIYSKKDIKVNVKQDTNNINELETPLLDEEKKREREEWENQRKRTSLRCGHQFHKGCISKWLLKNLECPICREKMGDVKNDDNLREHIMNIQTSLHPNLNGYHLNYVGERYIVARRRYRYGPVGYNRDGSHTGAASSHSHSHGGGGASSGW